MGKGGGGVQHSPQGLGVPEGTVPPSGTIHTFFLVLFTEKKVGGGGVHGSPLVYGLSL